MSRREPSEFQKFDSLVKKVIAVPHSEIKARMEEWKKQRKQKRTRKKAASHGPAA
jgi:hypothetical protein